MPLGDVTGLTGKELQGADGTTDGLITEDEDDKQADGDDGPDGI